MQVLGVVEGSAAELSFSFEGGDGLAIDSRSFKREWVHMLILVSL